MTESEERFAAYLDEHGYVAAFEPDWCRELDLPQAPSTNPDFLVARAGAHAICEVRQFDTEGIRGHLDGWGGSAWLSDKQVFGPVRRALAKKARQLLPFADCGTPLVIVVSNPKAAGVMLDDVSVRAAMFGNPSVTQMLDVQSGDATAAAEVKLEDYGVFRGIHPNAHISAVIVVHERRHADDWIQAAISEREPSGATIPDAIDQIFDLMPSIAERRAAGEEPRGAYRWVDVYEVPGCANPLPSDWFDGPRDRRYGEGPDGRYGWLDG